MLDTIHKEVKNDVEIVENVLMPKKVLKIPTLKTEDFEHKAPPQKLATLKPSDVEWST